MPIRYQLACSAVLRRTSRSILRYIIPAFWLVFSLGCSTHNFSHVRFDRLGPPDIDSDPSRSLRDLRSFAIVHTESDKTNEEDLVRKKVAYLFASLLQGIGYIEAEPQTGVDFLVTSSYSNDYHTVEVPPSLYTLPIYRPGETYTSYTNASAYDSYGGAAYGTAQTTTTTPGYWDTQAIVSPGYTIGRYIPSLGVSMWDSRDHSSIWSGSISASTRIRDVGVTMPFLAYQLLSSIPTCQQSPYIRGLKEGSLGEVNFFYTQLSLDGDTFYPTVVGIVPKSAADRAGLKEWDIVYSINGKSTANISAGDLIELTTGPIGKAITFGVYRNGKSFEVESHLEALDAAVRMRI